MADPSDELLPGDNLERILSKGELQLSGSEIEGIKEAMLAVEKTQDVLRDEGLSKMSFFLGVLNLMATTYILAGLPAYLWVWYCLKCVVLIPVWLYTVSRRRNGALYVLDYCWVANICAGIYFLLLLAGVVPAKWQRTGFLTFYSTALGPLGWASILLLNGIVFHSVERIASTFIHMSPILVCWTLVSDPDSIAKVWPDRFPTAAELEQVSAVDLYIHGIAFYLLWLTFHSVWLLSVGITCPEKGHDTVFNGLKAQVGKVSKLQGLRSQAAFYLCGHFVACAISFLWSIACYKFKAVHILFGGLLVVSTAWNGASYYEYIMANKYGKVLRAIMDQKSQKDDP